MLYFVALFHGLCINTIMLFSFLLFLASFRGMCVNYTLLNWYYGGINTSIIAMLFCIVQTI